MIKVVAGIITDNNKVLIAQRKKGKHLEYKWEFPGGKIEENETDEQALERELKEEFNIKVKVEDYITESVYDYDEKTIYLKAYLVKYISGEFLLNDHEQIKWVSKEDLLNYELAPADVPIAKKVINIK